MWRPVLLASLLITLALGGMADAKCRVCIESIRLDKGDTATALLVDVRSEAGTFPGSATAVVMQFGGNRAKCLNVGLVRTGLGGGIASYRGDIPSGYGSAFAGIPTFGGRIDVAGDIFEFTVPLDGTPGTVQLIDAAAAGQVAEPIAPVVTAAAIPTPVYAPDPRTATASSGLDPSPIALLGFAVILTTLAGAYVDRRRALARAST